MTHPILACERPDGTWHAFSPTHRIVADYTDGMDIKLCMAKAIRRQTGDRIEDIHIAVTVVDGPTIVAAEQA